MTRTDVPEIDLSDAATAADPFGTYGRARERSVLARLVAPGFAMWAVTRHDAARRMLADPRFALTSETFLMRPQGIPEHYQPYLRTMQEMEGPEHARLRRLASPAFTPARSAAFRPRIEQIADALLDRLADHAGSGPVDLLEHVARPLPIEVICELVGVPHHDRTRWHGYGAAVAAGHGEAFTDAVPRIIDAARAAVAHKRAEPADDLLSTLLRVRSDDGDRLAETELVTLVWHLLLAGQTPTNLLPNAVQALLTHPDQLAHLRDEPGLMPRAVEELLRWCGPQLLSLPRYAQEDVEIDGVLIGKGEPVVAAIVSANRDPRVFDDPDSLVLDRSTGPAGHLGFAHGPHFCLGAGPARIQTDVALTRLLHRFPDLALADADPAIRPPDPGTWRLLSLPVTL